MTERIIVVDISSGEFRFCLGNFEFDSGSASLAGSDCSFVVSGLFGNIKYRVSFDVTAKVNILCDEWLFSVRIFETFL